MNSRAMVMAFLYAWVLSLSMTAWADETKTGPTVVTSPSVPGATEAQNVPVMTDILDIKPPRAIGFDPRIITWILAAVAVVVLLILVFFLIDRYLKKRKKKDPGQLEPVIPPDKLAIRELDHIEKEGFDDARLFYFNLTAVLKTYLDGRFGLDAPEMTTEELIPGINALPLDRGLALSLKELLKRSDPVKFAGLSQERDRMIGDLEFTRRFVNQTREILEESGVS